MLYKIIMLTFIYQPEAVVYISNYMLLSINITRTVLMCIPSILYIIFILDIGYIIWEYDYILSNIATSIDGHFSFLQGVLYITNEF
jgi:hypothetical protein